MQTPCLVRQKPHLEDTGRCPEMIQEKMCQMDKLQHPPHYIHMQKCSIKTSCIKWCKHIYSIQCAVYFITFVYINLWTSYKNGKHVITHLCKAFSFSICNATNGLISHSHYLLHYLSNFRQRIIWITYLTTRIQLLITWKQSFNIKKLLLCRPKIKRGIDSHALFVCCKFLACCCHNIIPPFLAILCWTSCPRKCCVTVWQCLATIRWAG